MDYLKGLADQMEKEANDFGKDSINSYLKQSL